MIRLLNSAALVASVLGAAQAVTPSNPFCGYNTARNEFSVTLACTGTGVISAINFASYGTPTGSCPSYAVNASCNAANSLQVAQQACLNKTYCTIDSNAFGGDPCEGVVKSIAVVATCSQAPGGYQVLVVPSCATTDADPPCPLPTWEPTWQMNRSTICQPGNTDGYLNATEAARWGLVSLDWSIANRVWNTGLNNATGAATLVEQCRQIKEASAALGTATKCFVYRNTELALQWMEPQRAVMQDPAFAGWFLQYQPGNPSNTPPGTLYNEPAGAPAAGFAQYFWNYSNPDAFAYVLWLSEQGSLGTASPYVDGTFLDDSQGLGQEHPNAPANMGLSPLQTAVLTNDSHRFVQAAIDTLSSSGKYIWQGFNNIEGGDPDELMPAPSQGDCVPYMQRVCDPSWQAVPYTMQWPGGDTQQALAAFLIGRGPYAYVGWGWNGGPLPTWDPLFDTDVGTPQGLCSQPSPGVFQRAWSSGMVQLNCTSWTAVLP